MRPRLASNTAGQADSESDRVTELPIQGSNEPALISIADDYEPGPVKGMAVAAVALTLRAAARSASAARPPTTSRRVAPPAA